MRYGTVLSSLVVYKRTGYRNQRSQHSESIDVSFRDSGERLSFQAMNIV